MATVLLGMLDYIMDAVGAPAPAMTVGFCAHAGIKLYRQRASNYPYPFYRA